MKFENLLYERERQLSIHLDNYVHEALDMHKDVYVNAFPVAVSQPEEFSHRYDIPLFVTAIHALPLDVQMSFIGGVNLISEDIMQWGQRPPRAPYMIWNNGGISNRNKSVVTVRRLLPRDSRGSVISEGIFQTLVRPESVRGFTLDLPGSSVGRESVASLSFTSDQPKLFDDWPDRAFPGCGSLVCNKE